MHTKGPWQISHKTKQGIFIVTKNKYLTCIAHCDTLERDDNARLIATAPELLTTLKELKEQAVKDAEKYAPEGNEPIWAFIEDAQDAITKAERG